MWLSAARPGAHPLVFAPLFFGQSLALIGCGRFSWTLFVWTHLLGVLVHALVVFGRAAADGPRRGKPPVRVSIAITFASLLGLAGVGAVLAFTRDRAFMLALVMLPSMLLWLDSFPPLALRRRGLEHWLHAIALGAVLPALGFYAQCGDLLRVMPLAFAISLLAAIAAGIAIARDSTRTTRAISALILLVAVSLTPLALPGSPVIVGITVVLTSIIVLIGLRRRDHGRQYAGMVSIAVITAQLGWAACAWSS